MKELFFNARAWRQVVGEQEVKFLEELWTRAGGAPPPTQDLGQVTETVTVIESSASQQTTINNITRRDLLTALNLAQETQQALNSEIKRLSHRINQLEDSQ